MDMIGGIHKHGRTDRDNSNLFRHLTKDARKIEICNSVASNLEDLMSDLSIMRDATKADAAFYHVFLSPSNHMTDDQLRSAAQTVISHMGAQDNPYAIIYHDKDRKPGGGNKHVHLVIGRVDSSLRVLENKFEKIRLETAVRICEYELGENPVLGRHYKSSMKWLEEHRPEVSDWLYGHFGNDAPKPKSPASPAKRQGLERQGVSLSGVKSLLETAFTGLSNGQSFYDQIKLAGLSIEAGKKAGVYILKLGDIEVGSVDRLLKIKRAEAQKLLENINLTKDNSHGKSELSNSETCKSNLSESGICRADLEAIASSTGRKQTEQSREPLAEHPRDFGSTPELKQNSTSQLKQSSGEIGRNGISVAQEAIACAALSNIKINENMRQMIDEINLKTKKVKSVNPEIWKISLFEKIRRRFSSAFLRLKECLEMLNLVSEDNTKRFTKVDKDKLKDAFISPIVVPNKSYKIKF